MSGKDRFRSVARRSITFAPHISRSCRSRISRPICQYSTTSSRLTARDARARPESGFSALREIGRNYRERAVPWRVDPYCRSLSSLRHAAHFHVTRRSGIDYPDRVKTVSKLGALEPLGLALSEKQIPQIVENT